MILSVKTYISNYLQTNSKNLYKRFPFSPLLSSGVKSVDKRDGSGSHNWGTYEDDIKAEQDQANTSTDENGQPIGKIVFIRKQFAPLVFYFKS